MEEGASKDDQGSLISNDSHSDTHHKSNGKHDLLLRCWAPITTRLLEGAIANSNSWYVMDNVMEEPTNFNFVSYLRQELDRNGILKRLSAARTTGERQTNDILSLLQQNGLMKVTEEPTAPPTSVRGDKSTFLGRDLRQQQATTFSSHFPHLNSLIHRLEQTAQHFLGHCMELDFNLTSVQVAEFPGDGASGYPRHCDRNGNLCRQEKETSSTASNSERLLTGVYYLTPDDWDPKLDGGCLRLFEDDNDNSQQQRYVDVAPYSNRMILFRSDGVEHEVRPSLRRPRLALTIWLYGRIIGKKADGNVQAIENNKEENRKETMLRQNGNSNNTTVQTNSIPTGPPPLPVTSTVPSTTSEHRDTQQQQERKTVFVSIAAYRDSETGPTLRHLAAMATHPERVFVGLMLQLDEQDSVISQSLPTNDPWYKSNVRCLQLEARHAVGPCYARALCQSLYRDEDYVLQIDSHMRFRKHWDTYLIQELETLITDTNHEKVMLTAYPVGYQLPNQIPSETRGTLLVPWKFDENGLLRQRGRLFQSSSSTDSPKQAIPCHLYAAGFNFSRFAAIQDCPYDESLHHLFFGEELSMAVRLYTKGYDLYAPSKSVCYHLWSRAHRPTPTTSHKPKQTLHNEQRKKQQSMEVVKQQLIGTADVGRYGLGSVRTAQQFAEALGANFVEGTILNGITLPEGVQFVSDTDAEFAPESLGAKVQTLDANAKNLIAAFLQQMN